MKRLAILALCALAATSCINSDLLAEARSYEVLTTPTYLKAVTENPMLTEDQKQLRRDRVAAHREYLDQLEGMK